MSTAELLGLGFTRREIHLRVVNGQLVHRHRGVYVVGPGALSREGELAAAALFAGPDGCVSRLPSAGLLRLLPSIPGGVIDVTCPRRIAAPEGIRAHRSRLARDERTIVANVPVTTTGRTILDCAARASTGEIERMLTRAFMLGLPIRPPLPVLLARHPRRPGAPTVRAALARFEGGRTLTKSDLEDRFLDFLDRYGLPRPLTNHPVKTAAGTYEIDCCWPKERLAIEVDAPSTHGSRPTMLSDRRRDRAATLAGWTPGRVMEDDLDDEAALAAEMRSLLAAAEVRRAAGDAER